MAANRDAKRFVQLLATKLSKDERQLDQDDLEEYFRGSLETLPRIELKTALENDFHSYLKQLHRAVGTSKTKILKPAEKGNESVDSYKQFNLFERGALDNVLKSATHMSLQQRTAIYDHLWNCYPFVHGSEKLFSTLSSSSEAEEKGGESDFQDTLQVISKCKQVTFGCCSEQSIGDCMKFFLSELTPWCEYCIGLPSSEERKKRALELQKSIHSIVILMHFRWQDCESKEEIVNCRESYRDPMAALLSLYIDMLLLSEIEETEDTSAVKGAGNLVLYILGVSPTHCIDVLLQSSAVTNESILSITPVIRSVLRINTGPLTNCHYIKYVLLARSCLVKGRDSQENVTAIRQTVEEQAAPPKFVSWLSKKDERLKENLGLLRKMTGTQVTRCLLHCENDEALESLLDIACDAVIEESLVSTEEAKELTGGNAEAQKPDEQPLFFLDASGDANIDKPSQAVEYEENEREERLLHKQLRSLFGQMKKDSDSEDENYLDVEIDELSTVARGQGLDSLQASSENLISESITNGKIDVSKKRKTTDVPQIEVIDEASIENLKQHELFQSSDASNRVKTRKSRRKFKDKTQTEALLELTGDSQGVSGEVMIKVVNDEDVDVVVSSQEEENTKRDSTVAVKQARKTGSKMLEIEVIDDKDVDIVVGSTQEEGDTATAAVQGWQTSRVQHSTKHPKRTRTPKNPKKKGQTTRTGKGTQC